MRKLYEMISNNLKKVDFDAIWKNFKCFPFALYDKETVYFADGEIPYDERFVGNTAIQYDGGYIAIWYVDDISSVDTEELAANMVHEMFHAFQLTSGESRFPDEFVGLDAPDTLENHVLRRAESIALADAVDASDMAQKLDLLKKFLSLRKHRISLFGGALDYEFHIETVEGAAEYCGTRALSYISPEKYRKRIALYAEQLRTDDALLFEMRHFSYQTGTLLLLTLDALSIPYSKRIAPDVSEIFLTQAYAALDVSPLAPSCVCFPSLEAKYAEVAAKRAAAFTEFYAKDVTEHTGDYSICGFDPMNIKKLGGKLLHSHFVALVNRATGEKLFLNGPVVTHCASGGGYAVSKYEI